MDVVDLIRKRFESVNADYLEASNGKTYAEISKLRIEKTILAGVGRYEFNIKNTSISNAREKALDRNDVFIPNFLGLFVALQSTSNPETCILFPYVPVAPTSGSSVHEVGFTDAELNTLYNGTLNWTVDNGVMISAYPTERFKKVPQTQGLFVLDNTNTAVNENIQSEFDVLEGCDLLTPKLTIAGTRDHRITVNFDAAGLQFACTSGYTPTLVLYMDGFLVKGGCEFYDGQNPNAKAVGTW